jgi:acetate kinase
VGKILIVNTGSSSLKCAIYDCENDALLVKVAIERLGSRKQKFISERFYDGSTGPGEVIQERPVTLSGVKAALRFTIDFLLKERLLVSLKELRAVGHRVVHGAEAFTGAVLVTREVKKRIRDLAAFAPLHNPFNLKGIELCEKLLNVPQVAVFDTAFHQTLPRKAFLYGISLSFYKEHGIRKYGFHGTNHKYCALRVKELLGQMPRRVITCHLGNGSSVTAIEDGRSIDTSMGFTPTDGLIMGTRSGAIDPEVILYLLRELKKSPQKIDHFLNKESGLKSIAGSSDIRDIWTAVKKGDKDAKLALEMLAYETASFIGSYATALNGIDALVFSGGIGENAWFLRSEICNQLGHLGVMIDTDKNQHNREEISKQGAKVRTFVVRANEELQIGRESFALLDENQ